MKNFMSLNNKEKRNRLKRKTLLFIYNFIDTFCFNLVKVKNKILKPRFKCYMCNNEFYSYYPFDRKYLKLREIESGVKYTEQDIIVQYRCPCCDSLSRKRMMFAYLEPLMDGFGDILYMSPSQSGMNYIKSRLPMSTIITNDKFEESCDYNYDIEDMAGFEDNSFDLIICSHILEHVGSDVNALKEMYRVIRPEGVIVVIVPIMLEGDVIEEDNTLTIEENWRRFGDATHVRAYSKDGMFSRIKGLGYEVLKIEKEYFDKEFQYKNALAESDCLYIIRKS